MTRRLTRAVGSRGTGVLCALVCAVAWCAVTASAAWAGTLRGTVEHGEFVLGNVPPGQYTLHVWQESLGTVTKDVTVGEHGVTAVTVEITRK